MTKLIIDGEQLDFLTIVDDFIYHTGEVSIDKVDIPGASHNVVRSKNRAAEDITVPVVYHNINHGLNKTYDEIIEHMHEVLKFRQDEPVKLGTNESEFYNVGHFVGRLETSKATTIPQYVRFDLTFSVIDYYRYSYDETVEVFNEDILAVDNHGEKVRPMIELTAIEDIKGLEIYNSADGEFLKLGEESMLSVDVEEVEVLKSIFKVPNDLDVYTLELGDLFGVNQYGAFSLITDNGDENIMNIKLNAVNDLSFKAVYSIVDMATDISNLAYISLYNNTTTIENPIVKLELKNNYNVDNHNRERVYMASAVKYLNNETYRTHEFNTDTNGRTFRNSEFIVRVDRIGHEYNIAVSRRDTSTEILLLNRRLTLTDKEGRLYDNGEITDIAIGFLKNSDEDTTIKINLKELNLVSLNNNEGEETTRSLLYADDVIVIDNDKKLITRNGEPVNYTKDIRSNFLELKKGINELKIYPRGKLIGEMKYRERRV